MNSPDPITRLNAALEGRYRIERELGEGGMATVYLADDIKHERKVALKVLKPELAAVVGAERFLAEIKTTANLQHPHILPLFDSGEADSFLFYVMPYVEGETLRDRLGREHQLPVEDAVRIAWDVAEALDYAHGHGVIHRDIKPANILMQAGRPVIADFGIALAVGTAGQGRLTETGLSMGTPHYMSPEQATGDLSVGAATDIYALGCVLYEMLIGEPPYTGSTAQAILGKIIAGELATATKRRASVPANVDAAIRKALEKLPADRFTGAHDFAKALADPGFRHGETEATEAVASVGPWNRVSVVSSSLLVVACALAAWGWLRPTPQPGEVMRTVIDLGDIVLVIPLDQIIVSPDGSRFATTGTVDGERALYWRHTSEESFRSISGTEDSNGGGAAFSPEGDWLVYATPSALLKVSLSGGVPTTVVRSGELRPFSPSWGDNGMIVFTGPTGMYLVPETGGEPALLRDGGEAFYSPSLLPGGWAVIGNWLGPAGGIMLLDLETDSTRELIPEGRDPKYVETGHLLYVDDSGRLWAVAFDEERGELLGDAVPVLDEVSLGFSNSRYSVSRNGTLVYGAGGGFVDPFGDEQLVVLDLEGNEEALALTPRNIGSVGWPPDGRSIVYSGVREGDVDRHIYTYNTVLNTEPRQLTFEGDNANPVYSPDGTRVAFSSSRDGTDGTDLFVVDLNDGLPPRSMITLEANQYVTQWPSDSLIVFERGANDNRNLWTIDLSNPDSVRAEEYLGSEADLRSMVVSPDGTVAAYRSNESGQDEIYIRSFPDPGGLTMVSQGGGEVPFWSLDGNTLYYTTGQNRPWMVARLQRNPVPVVLALDTLFATVNSSSRPFQGSGLHPDGDRFIIARDPGSTDTESGVSEPERFLVVTNWFTELCERMGGC